MAMKVRFDLRKRFFPSGFTGDYELESELDPHAMPELVDRAINELVPVEALHGRDVIDVKGRDPQSLLDPDTPPEHLPRGEELVYVAGRVFLDESMLGGGKSAAAERGRPFEMRLFTTFKEFSGHHHIVHGTGLEHGGEALAGIEPAEIGRVVPVAISRFRLGIELFRSRFMTGALGYTPTVSESFLLDASSGMLRLRIWAEAMKTRSQIPLQRDGLFDKASLLVRDLIGFDLASDYRLKSGELE